MMIESYNSRSFMVRIAGHNGLRKYFGYYEQQVNNHHFVPLYQGRERE
jgi:hypothetical protein